MPTRMPSRKPSRRKSAPTGVPEVDVVIVEGEPKLGLREKLGMTREDFGRLVNVSVRAIAAVERDKKYVGKLLRPYVELARLYMALCEVVEPRAIRPWFKAPNPAFGGLKPMELIERGEIDRIWDMVYRLQTGVPG